MIFIYNINFYPSYKYEAESLKKRQFYLKTEDEIQ